MLVFYYGRLNLGIKLLSNVIKYIFGWVSRPRPSVRVATPTRGGTSSSIAARSCRNAGGGIGVWAAAAAATTSMASGKQFYYIVIFLLPRQSHLWGLVLGGNGVFSFRRKPFHSAHKPAQSRLVLVVQRCLPARGASWVSFSSTQGKLIDATPTVWRLPEQLEWELITIGPLPMFSQVPLTNSSFYIKNTNRITSLQPVTQPSVLIKRVTLYYHR